MSRIHEAIKRAEEEQLLRPSPAKQSGTVNLLPQTETLTSGSLVETEMSKVLVESEAAVAADGQWLEKVSVREWKPDTKRILFADNSHHYESGMEEFRTLRSRLYQIREKTPIRTIMIASALPGEGKTFVSSNLGYALVRQHGRRVLIIDADIRKPHLHECMGTHDSPGLNEYLAGKADETAIIQRGPKENLYFIAGGRPGVNPSELIGNGKLKLLLDNVSSAFDWIVMDSPPVVPISDASVIARTADAIVLVVRAENTPIEIVQKAKQELKDHRIAGVVLNRTAEEPGYSSYYYSNGRSEKN